MSRSLRGIGTIEVLLALSLFMLISTFLISALLFSLHSTKVPNTRREAMHYAEEGLEIARYIRKDSLLNLADGTYGLTFSAGDWIFTSNNDAVEPGFTRSIIISTVDQNTKKVEARIDWDNGLSTGSESLVSLVTNWKEALSFAPSWSNPFQVAKYNASANYDVYGLNIDPSTDTLYAEVRISKKSRVYSLDVSDIQSIFELDWDSFGVQSNSRTFYGNKVYITSTADNKEFASIIINSRNSIWYFGKENLKDKDNAYGSASDGNYIYVTRAKDQKESEYYTLLETLYGGYNIVGRMEHNKTLRYIILNDNYAYVDARDQNGELIVISNANPASPSIVNVINTPSTVRTSSSVLGISGDYLYIMSRNDGIHIYDISNPSNPVYVTTYTGVLGYVYDYAFDHTNNILFVGTSNSSNDLQIVNIANPAFPSIISTYNANTRIRALTFDSVNNRLYGGTSRNSNEILVFEPS